MRTPNAADVGIEMVRYLRSIEGTQGNPVHCRALVDMLIGSRAENVNDALALVAWLATFLPAAAAQMDDDEGAMVGPKATVLACALLAMRAQEALVRTTGVPPEAFIGPPARTH